MNEDESEDENEDDRRLALPRRARKLPDDRELGVADSGV